MTLPGLGALGVGGGVGEVVEASTGGGGGTSAVGASLGGIKNRS